MTLTLDNWHDRKDLGEVVENPSLSQVLGAIALLDGVARTMVSLGKPDAIGILVAGPKDGEYIVNATLDNREFFSLRKPHPDPEKVICFVGGQDGNYRKDQFVSKQDCEKAVAFFYENQKLCSGLEWQKDRSDLAWHKD